MHPRHVPGLVLASLATALAAAAAAAAPPFTATEMMKLGRLADPQLSPDGTQVAYALTEIDLAGATRNTDLWLVPVAGGEPRRLTVEPGLRLAAPLRARTGGRSRSSRPATARRRCGRSTSRAASRASSRRSRPASTPSSGSTPSASRS